MTTKKLFSEEIIKTAAVFVVLGGIFFIVYISQSILIPIILGFIFAILLLPMVHFLKKRLRFNDLLSVITAVIIALICIVLLILIMGNQIIDLFKDMPEIKRNLYTHFEHIQSWVHTKFNMSYSSQKELLSNTSSSLGSKSMASLNGITSVLINSILIPIYTFLFLIYRKNFIQFAHAFDSKNHHKLTQKILLEINHVIRKYIIGLGIEMLIVAVLTGFGLWLVGIKYFIFLGALTAMLNLIPYIGIIIACAISILMSVVGTTDLNIIFGVVVVNGIVQLIDNNFLMPKIVGSQVKINALASILAVIIGGSVAGAGGMFLALPILATLKVIFDHVEAMNPFTHLIGE